MVWSEVVQSCPTLCDPVDCSPPDSSIHGIFQVRILEWVAISFSRGSSRPRDRTRASCTAGRQFTVQSHHLIWFQFLPSFLELVPFLIPKPTKKQIVYLGSHLASVMFLSFSIKVMKENVTKSNIHVVISLPPNKQSWPHLFSESSCEAHQYGLCCLFQWSILTHIWYFHYS